MENVNRRNLRIMVRGTYDLQKLRIMMGNRIVINFRAKLGQTPGKPTEELDEDAKDILRDLAERYRKVMDGLTGKFPSRGQFVGDEVISTYTELCLLRQYIEIEDSEARGFKHLRPILEEFPIYTEFLTKIKGLGDQMAAVILSEIDITRARYVSSLWKYAGLDVVSRWELEAVLPCSGDIPAWAMERIPIEQPFLPRPDDDAMIEAAGVVKTTLYAEAFTGRVPFDTETLIIAYEYDPARCGAKNGKERWTAHARYKLKSLGGRSRKKEHLVTRVYTDREGEEKTKQSITFNPWLKTKLLGVMAGCFLKARSPYAEVYNGYKARLENHTAHKDKSKGQRHRMAMRYMVKMFLRDLYVEWRKLEGLPVEPPYHEAKLGLRHAG